MSRATTYKKLKERTREESGFCKKTRMCNSFHLQPVSVEDVKQEENREIGKSCNKSITCFLSPGNFCQTTSMLSSLS